MERLTAKNKHGKPIIKDWPNYMEFDITNRLAAIEDILGGDYDLARLRELVTADEDGLYTRTVTGVITQSEYEVALAEKGAENAQDV